MKGLLSPLFIDVNFYNQSKEDIWAENWKYFKIFSLIAALAFLAMASSSLVFAKLKDKHTIYVVYLLITLALFLSSFLKPKKVSTKALLIYTFCVEMFSFGIVLGVWLSLTELSVTFIVFLLTVPLLFTTRPLYTNAMVFAAMAFFSVSSYLLHPREIFLGNLINVILFGVVSMLLSLLITRIKIDKYRYHQQTAVLKQQNQETDAKFTAFENFVSDMVRFASSEDEPRSVLDQLLQFMAEQLHADRAYIFEANAAGSFDNTYEWCREGVPSEKANLQGVPYRIISDMCLRQFQREKNVVIRDAAQYKSLSRPVYDLLKSQNIQTLVAGPIIIDGKTVGVYGVDNPPTDDPEGIVKLIGLAESIICLMIRLRNNSDSLERSATHDQLTGCKNRTALEWAYSAADIAIGVLMCDLNGLKEVNDKLGHNAGDEFIIRVTDTLRTVFGADYVYRMGGDEFLALVTGIPEDAFAEKVSLARLQLGTTASLGAAYTAKVQGNFSVLLKDADEKMYADKKAYYAGAQTDRRKNHEE